MTPRTAVNDDTRVMWPMLLVMALITTTLVGMASIVKPYAGIDLHEYLPLHSAMEFWSIAIAMMVFSVDWNMPNHARTNHSITLGFLFGAVAIIDFGHMMSYQGMPDFITENSPQKAIWFWLAGRSLLAMAMLYVAFVPERTASHGLVCNIKISVIGAALLAVMLAGTYGIDMLPNTYVPGKGVTAFKTGAELALISAFAVAALGLAYRNNGRLGKGKLATAALVFAMAEVFMIMYVDVSDIYNIVGHAFKVVAYWLICRALFINGVQVPYKQLAEREALYRATVQQAADGIDVVDMETGCFIEVNEASCRARGVGHHDLVGKKWSDDERLIREDIRNIERFGSIRAEREQPGREGTLMTVDMSAQLVSVNGRHLVVSVWRNVTERRKMESLLRLAHTAMDSMTEAVIITDASGVIVDVNNAFTEITGYSAAEAKGKGREELMIPTDHDPEACHKRLADVEAKLRRFGAWEGEVVRRKKDGGTFLQFERISPVISEGGIQKFRVVVASDVTDFRRNQDAIEHMAYYDALTSLPNRTLLADRLEKAIASATRRGAIVGIAYLDLDRFKPINDDFGHATGDRLLVEVSKRLQSTIRTGDTVARLGGDEFVIVVTDATAKGEIETTMQRVLDGISQPFVIDGQEMKVTASIGVTLYPHDGHDVDALIRHADQAMYAAKQLGTNRFHVFDPEQDKKTRESTELVNSIEAGLSNSEFVLFYQPKASMRTGSVSGVEALVRWKKPGVGLLSPASFIDAVEEGRLARQFGEWVISTAVAQIGEWKRQGIELKVSINCSVKHLQHEEFVEHIWKVLQRNQDVRPADIELEIVETAAMSDMEAVSRVIDECSQLGISFALDDFGTGYSSLTYFRRIPAESIKIDQSFIKDMIDDSEDRAIVEGVIGMAKAFDRAIVAEGVETVEHGMLLIQMGCDIAQGYGIARPMPAHEIPAWLKTWSHPSEWRRIADNPFTDADKELLYAEIGHRRWMAEIADMANGRATTSPAAVSPSDCRLGKWYYGDGKEKYGEIAQFATIEKMHDATHSAANRIIEEYRATGACSNLSELAAASRALCSAITDLRMELRNRRMAAEYGKELPKCELRA